MGARFVVNADDLGLARGATLGIIRAHLEGVVTSASISPTGKDYRYAVDTTRDQCPELGLGLHFTLSAGKPVCSPEVVPLLVDENGDFRWEFVSLLRALRFDKDNDLLSQIELELEAQVQKLLTDGILPDHINSERHIHMIPGIFDRVVQAARRHGIPYVRAGNDISPGFARFNHFKPLILKGGVLKFILLQGLRSRCLSGIKERDENRVSFPDHFASYLFTGRLDLILRKLFLEPREGVTEIMVHPGIPEESAGVSLGNPGVEHYLTEEDRRRELDACVEARAFAGNVELGSFRALANRTD